MTNNPTERPAEHSTAPTAPSATDWTSLSPSTPVSATSTQAPTSTPVSTAALPDELTVILRVNRFTPRPERDRGRRTSPFERSSSPFGTTSAPSPRARQRGRQWTQDYTITMRPEDTLLDCLLSIKRTQDPTLAFRYSCGHGMCGSDAANVNGTPTLLCSATLSQWIDHRAGAGTDTEGFRRTGDATARKSDTPTPPSVPTLTPDLPASPSEPPIIELSALPGFRVIRDLVVDIDPMLDQIRRLKPYLIHKGGNNGDERPHDGDSEYLQTPEQLSAYDVLATCIACGVCEGSCPVYAGGEAFMGPAALIWASRFINDSRDDATERRKRDVDTDDGISSCQSVRACSRQCPQGIDVGEEMWRLITTVREG
ncbi:2Fe-2S iron-sulfur cluster-binding protein [uncultured Bifidobacterium sp.]|uniref:2Fe-2S iron-sulfur cluster-binding protein n=1 Tax=uncultured Bifidobacterium sp. TaxID=165187 RepID=UPI0026265C2B|nr:2Fe-2S iron-sulfur cluster-binding protein [uncultured Bifidobacterium sp.]